MQTLFNCKYILTWSLNQHEERTIPSTNTGLFGRQINCVEMAGHFHIASFLYR